MDSLIHIAVVDDDPDIRDVISTYLTEEGYSVSACMSGDEMWAALDGMACPAGHSGRSAQCGKRL